MIQKCFLFQTLIVFLANCVVLISGDEGCQPGNVRNVYLSGNSTLSWDPPLTENCEIAYYLVNVTRSWTDEVWIYEVTERKLDVGHLDACVRYDFKISQVTTDKVTGSSTNLNNIITPPPDEADLALDYLTLTTIGTTRRDIRLQWSLQKEWILCSQRYRLVIVNENRGTVQDIYVGSSSTTIVGLTPCASYTFTVRALFTLEEEGPPAMVKHISAAANTTTPTVENISLASTSVVLTLGLQRVEVNSCSILSINVDSPQNFNVAFPVRDQDNRHTFKANLTGLQPNNLYYLQISAENSAGITSPILLAVQTLEST